MVDEDVVIGYVLGRNAVKIAAKVITQNGVYHAADDGLNGFGPVTVDVAGGLTDDELKKLINIIADLLNKQLADEWTGEGDPPILTPPDIIIGDLHPIEDGAEPLYITSAAAGSRYSYCVYGVVGTYNGRPAITFYTDTYYDGNLIWHTKSLTIPDYGTIPGSTATLNLDGTVTVVATFSDGTTRTTVYGPYTPSGYNNTWCI